MRLTKYQYKRLQADIGGLTTLYAIIKAEKNKEKNLNQGFDLGSYWRRERDSNPRYAFNVHTISNRALSTSQTSLQSQIAYRIITYREQIDKQFGRKIFLLLKILLRRRICAYCYAGEQT